MIQLFNHQRSGCVTSFFTQGKRQQVLPAPCDHQQAPRRSVRTGSRRPVEGITIFGIKNSMINPKENNTYLVFLNIFSGYLWGYQSNIPKEFCSISIIPLQIVNAPRKPHIWTIESGCLCSGDGIIPS